MRFPLKARPDLGEHFENDVTFPEFKTRTLTRLLLVTASFSK
jgi:hypothetical protein